MYFRPLLMMTFGMLTAASLYGKNDRLEAYAKFNMSYAFFSSMDSTNNNNDGWDFDQTSGPGVEFGTVFQKDNGLRYEFGFLIKPNIHFDGAQVDNGKDIPNSDADLYLDAYTLLADVNWEFTNGFMSESPLQGFLGLGLGFSYLDTDRMENKLGAAEQVVEGEGGWNLAFRFSLGVQYQFSQEFILTCSYSYMYLGEAELKTKWKDNTGGSGNDFSNNLNLDLEAQVLQIGLNYVF